MSQCKICGRYNCKEHSFYISKNKVTEFSGSSPPEVFVGKWNYPHVYAGILSPQEHGETEFLSSPELWHERSASIKDIVGFREKLIYGRQQQHIKTQKQKFLSVMREVAMTHRSVSAEFKLRKPVSTEIHNDKTSAIIKKAAPVEHVKLQENPKIEKKVDYLVNDTAVKSSIAIKELYKSNIPISNIIKILSAGLLGLKKNRRLVPTRWSITATDDTLSKDMLKKIKYYPEISNIQLHSAEYLGNHYEFLLLPGTFSFEVIERHAHANTSWQDYESFFQRKTYAKDVTGAYYVNRLALAEYLEKIKRQAQCLVIREITNEYTTPLGVGILRQVSREAFKNAPEKFNTIPEAMQKIQERIKQHLSNFTSVSKTLKDYGKQKRLVEFM